VLVRTAAESCAAGGQQRVRRRSFRRHTKVLEQRGQVCFWDVETVVFPKVVGKIGVLFIRIVEGDPEFFRVIQIGQINGLSSSERRSSRAKPAHTHLQSLERSVADVRVLGEGSRDHLSNLLGRCNNLDSRAEVCECRGSVFRELRVRRDDVQQIPDRSQPGVCVVLDCNEVSSGSSQPQSHSLRTLSNAGRDNVYHLEEG
jgi:hypothetical protein